MKPADPVINPAELPKKIGRFELSDDLSNIKSDLADYAKRHIKGFASNQRLIEGILSANLIISIIKRDVLLDPYLRELFPEQGKRLPLNQDKSLGNLLHKRFSLFMGHLAKFGQL